MGTNGNGNGLAGSATFPIGRKEGKDENGKEGCIINVCHRIGVACQILSGEEEGGQLSLQFWVSYWVSSSHFSKHPLINSRKWL